MAEITTGTVVFEPSGQYKKTRFFRTVVNSAGNTVQTVYATSQAKMYAGEDSVTEFDVNFRGYEIYIDESDDTMYTSVERSARITKDSTKTYEDGYDVYVSAEPTVGVELASSGAVKFQYLNTGNTADFAVIFVAEDK